MENDFGAVHGRTYLVEDDEGTQLAAFYQGNTWWEGHPDEDRRHQTQRPIVRLVLTPDHPHE